MLRTLAILCADDYALDDAVDRAVLDLARAERLSATSALVLSPRWREAAAPLAELRDRLSVGLHLDWTSEHAMAAGTGAGLGSWMARSALGLLSVADLVSHIERQCDAFEAAWGASPDHVDGHQHVHQFPLVRDALLQVLLRRYPDRKPWVRVSRVAQSGLKASVISAWGSSGLSRRLATQAWPQLSPLLGVRAFEADGARYMAQMNGWLAKVAKVGGLIMCHPMAGGNIGTGMGAARQMEYELIQSVRFEEALDRAGLHVATRRELHALLSAS